MKLIDVRLFNFRKHRNTKIAFAPGVNAIIGKNAAGKTTVLEAIVFGLTGALFQGNKESAITAGFDSGGVELNFQLNGKDGKITRYLEATRILLEYDGAIYRKATEVKEVWDKLLQVQPEFIENIITAKQSKIDALFSNDDEAAKEKLFQKIFLVPSTEKIRSSLYRNYMKQCPPLLPVEDPAQLQTIKNDKLKEIILMEKQMAARTYSYCANLEFELKNEKLHIEKCIRQGSAVSVALRRKQNAETMLQQEEAKIEELREILGSVDINAYIQELEILRKEAHKAERKNKLLKAIAALPPAVSKQEEEQHLKDYNSYGEVFANAIAQIATLEAENGVLSNLCSVELHSGSTCPTCKQSVTHLPELIEESSATIDANEAKLLELYSIRNDASHRRTKSMNKYNEVVMQMDTRNRLEHELRELGHVEDCSDLQDYEQIVKNYNSYKEELNHHLESAANWRKLIHDLTLETANAAIYDGPKDPQDRLEEVLTELQKLDDLRVAEQTMAAKLQIARARVIELDERINVALRDSDKNAKRNRYMEVITRIYDGFHVANFPRKLVQSYTSAVTERLQEKLEAFDIPFDVKLNDKFETLVYDKEGRRIPAVSGGQKVLLGLSLHLALHDLFSQSFPLFMIDEGTTHLDSENVAKYFQFIANLKTEKKLNQIIIIDHHPELKNVVDHVIEL